jgi:hypothetical protein
MEKKLTVRHESPAQRFAVRLDDQIAYLSYEDTGEGVLDFAHVYVPPEYRSQGIAAEITRAALQYARENGYSIIPTCPYVSDYLRRHREYEDIVTD